MANNIELVITAKDEASAAFKEVNKSIEKTADVTGKATDATKKNKGALDGLLGSLNLAIDPISLVTKGLELAAAAATASAQAYAEAEVVNAQLNAVLQSTGNVAGLTSDELNNLADSLAAVSGMDDEVILRGEALLLTFTKIGGDVFPEATKAALNMSMAMGTDLQSSIIQVGKALNEPIEGVSALRRVGVQLTDAQQEQVKQFMAVNDIASAQKIILNELAVEFGGVAEAMGNTTTGSAERLKVAWGNLLETMGEDSAGIWRQTNEALIDIVIGLDNATKASKSFRDEIDRAEIDTTGWDRGYQSVIKFDEGVRDAIVAVEMMDWSNGEKQYEILSAAADEVIASNQEVVLSMSVVQAGINGVISDAYTKYTDKMLDLSSKHADLSGELKQLQDWGWSPTSDKVQDVTNKLRDNEQAQKDAAVAMQESIDKMIFQQAAAGLDAEATLELARAMGVMDEQTYAVASATEALRQQFLDGKLTAEEYANKVATLRDNVNNLQSKEITITMTTINRSITSGANYNPYASGRNENAGFAEGTKGWMDVPAGYPNDTYPVMVSSGEKFAVVPAGASPQPSAGAVGGVTLVFNYAPQMSLGNEIEARERIVPLVQDALRQFQLEGIAA